jgi:hypothetical protein
MTSEPPGEVLPFERPPAFYDRWQAGEGIPIYRQFHVEDLAEVELGFWRRFGCDGAFVNLADAHLTTAAILELPPGGATVRTRHMFEALIYGVSGRGRTTISAPGVAERTVEWGTHSLFSPPLNTTYRHENLDAARPLRLLMVTNAPLILSLFHDERFVFDCPVQFPSRFQGQADFFVDPGRYLGGRVWRTNFVPNVREFALMQWQARGAGARSYHLSMSENTMACHLSEFAVGTYKKAHRHGPGAHVVILKGEGYSLLWQEGQERVRVDWREGSMFAPPEQWYHQHFNTGAEPARYLALRRGGSPEHPLRLGGSEKGAEQIEYADEDPAIRELYASELAARGIVPRMPTAAAARGPRG